MIELTRLWLKDGRNGRFLVGRLAGARIFIFPLAEPDERGATHVVKLDAASNTRPRPQQPAGPSITNARYVEVAQ